MEYLIKKYSNRRLYDSNAGENITLARVAELVREGRNVKIVDNATGEDRTAGVLGQVFLQKIKEKPTDKESLAIMRALIAHGGESGMDILKKTMLASLGAFEITRQKAEEVIDTLIQKGELAKSDRSEAVGELMNKAQESATKLKDKVSDEVTKTVENLKVAKKKDLDALEGKVDQLIETVNRLASGLGGGASAAPDETKESDSE